MRTFLRLAALASAVVACASSQPGVDEPLSGSPHASCALHAIRATTLVHDEAWEYAVAQVSWCGNEGPTTLLALWHSPPPQERSLSHLAAASSHVREENLFAGLLAIVADTMQKDEVRIAAMGASACIATSHCSVRFKNGVLQFGRTSHDLYTSVQNPARGDQIQRLRQVLPPWRGQLDPKSLLNTATYTVRLYLGERTT
jgi:hypothetical protein